MARRIDKATRLIVDDYGTLTLYRCCSRCRRWAPQAIGHFSPRKRDKDTRRVVRWDAYCIVCRREVRRAAWHRLPEAERQARARAEYERVKADPELLADRRRRNLEAQRRRAQRNPAAVRAARRRWYARVKADPERLARYRESQRLGWRLRAEQERDIDASDLRTTTVVMPTDPSPRLPSAPLAAAVAAAVAPSGKAVEDFCTSTLQISERLLYAWTTGERPTVKLERADHVLVRLGLLWWEVWNENTVRVPLLRVALHTCRTKDRGRLRYWATGWRDYGDGGPDHAALANINRAWEAPATEEAA